MRMGVTPGPLGPLHLMQLRLPLSNKVAKVRKRIIIILPATTAIKRGISSLIAIRKRRTRRRRRRGALAAVWQKLPIVMYLCPLPPPLWRSTTMLLMLPCMLQSVCVGWWTVVLCTILPPNWSDFKDYTPCKGTVCLGDKSMIDQVSIGSVVFKTSLGTPITLSNMLHILSVKMHFMSTSTLAQNGAEVSFTQDSFKIIINWCHVAEGYCDGTFSS